MQFVSGPQKHDSDQRKLLDLYARLGPQDRLTLQAFAAFLAGRDSPADGQEEETVHQPKSMERPRPESVVKAIKRLSAGYYMLQRDKLFDETSSLMMSHVMQGREAESVIDELEALFARHYQDYLVSIQRR
ncbi:MAG: hypothetical protein KZQ76_04555 [Candidatus Thiodiazotropha sp. (ex Epidulcina cf. delphinae)]|nr:hypothetical protein [Candidatus Thiodiazotropha sp. (ex Epidulcina cf. delphinae)]